MTSLTESIAVTAYDRKKIAEEDLKSYIRILGLGDDNSLKQTTFSKFA